MTNALKNFEAARNAALDAEARGLSMVTQNKRWAAYLRAEDALKALNLSVAR